MQNYSSTVSPARLAVGLLALLGGCEQDPYEPNWLFHGRWISVDGRDREANETCAGTFEYLDRYAGAVAIEFGVSERLAPFRWYSPEQYYADAPCGIDPRPVACAWDDGAESLSIPQEHEVVHLANSRIAECPNILAEGLAGFYSTRGYTFESEALGKLAPRLQDPAKNIAPSEYGVAGRFVAYLVERFGIDAVLELPRCRSEVTNTGIHETTRRRPCSSDALGCAR